MDRRLNISGIRRLPFAEFTDPDGDGHGDQTGGDGGQDDIVRGGRAQVASHFDDGNRHQLDHGHGQSDKHAHGIAGTGGVTIFYIQSFHGFQGEDGGTVSRSEDVGHKAHDHHGDGLAVLFFGKEESQERAKPLCSLIDKS